MKFFVSFFILGFLFSVSVQAHADCGNYKRVSQLVEQKQEWVDWCTAAAVRVVTQHYGNTKSQCELVGDVVGKSCCLGTFFDAACHPDPPIWPHDVFNKVNYTYDQLEYLITPATGPPSPQDIIREICTYNRPLLAVASLAFLPRPNWHAVVVEAYRIEGTGEHTFMEVRVFDPQEDLCDSPSCTENPTFKSYDFFFLSEVDHDKDYVEIGPKSDTTPPASPPNLRVQ